MEEEREATSHRLGDAGMCGLSFLGDCRVLGRGKRLSSKGMIRVLHPYVGTWLGSIEASSCGVALQVLSADARS